MTNAVRHTLVALLTVTSACGGEGWRLVDPTVDRRPTVVLPTVSMRELPSGLTVVTTETADAGSVRMTLAMRAGHGDDPQDRAGIARVAAAALEISAAQPANEVRFGLIGATPAFQVTRAGMSVSIDVLPSDVSAGAQALAELVREPVPPEAIERARALRMAVLSRAGGSPDVLASIAIARLYAPAYQRENALGFGTPQSLAAISVSDVQAHLQRALNIRETALVVAGPIDQTHVEMWAIAAFQQWPQSQFRPPSGAARVLPRDREYVFIPMPGMDQTLIVVSGMRPRHDDPDAIAFDAAFGLLGAHLNHRLREELQMTYGLGQDLSAEDDTFGMSIRVRGDRTGVALHVIRNVLWEASGPQSDEWLRRRARAVSVYLMERMSHAEHAAEHGREVFLHRLGANAMHLTETAIRSLDADSVQSSALRYLVPARMRIIVVGDPAVVGAQVRREVDEWTPAMLLHTG
jgi:predicted Zn-dependent peptidase